MLSTKEIERSELKGVFGGAKKILVTSTFDLTGKGKKAYKPDAKKN